jgi:hypothetical protein
VAYEVIAGPATTQVRVVLPVGAGRHTLRLRHTGGIEWQPVDDPLTRGATSSQLRVIRAGLDDQTWRMQVEGLPGRHYPVDFFTDRSVVAAVPDRHIEKRPHGCRVELVAPVQAPTNAAGFVRWESSVRFRFP